jgi:hypothetical protein
MPHLHAKIKIKDDIDHSAGERGSHCKFRASVRTDDRIHCLTEHIEGDAKRYIKEIFF